MKVGIVLLSADNFYVGEAGQLPARPSFDKELLLRLTQGQRVIASPNTIRDLPNSILSTGYVRDKYKDYDLNMGIGTFRSHKPDIMIVIKSSEKLYKGKKFDMNWLKQNFKRFGEDKEVQLWV